MRFLRFGMQGKQILLAAAVAVTVLFTFYAVISSRIEELEKTKNRLEQAVAKLQVDRVSWGQFKKQTDVENADVDMAVADSDDLVVIYNRVPKTGSTSFAGVAYSLCSRNKYHVLHLNVSKNSHTMSLADQLRFVKNITRWNSMKPALYHGHLAYLEFGRFGIRDRPVYINIIRDPLDRLISYYYFMRFGDDFRPHLKRRKQGDKETFDQCVAKDGNDCDPVNLWLQIPFFCGHAAECWVPGNEWALQMAKYNLVNNYLVVGITEELEEFVAVLEATLPRMFKGALDMFISGEKSHLRKTTNKKPPSEETVSKIQESNIWKMEHDFYEFAKKQFHFIKSKSLQGDSLKPFKQLFFYEKIRPR
ncbi:heparan sulfate 2-O-sulfotransferase 1 [Lingula anatina]|uniref:Heparan sulfate 2-O-sulfotransferase 1 n=1 Tax=Lingula anatina TaxID=7574 RepID=A0A1S3KC26_LINAN|nr:heparan sulfate 2-O-sulfotransferase 1 [Lingula anatina]|eukprot:XP_013420047.1 heparan sulfate 2-O-sulfotransferase 1 [Lingula anatina]